MTGALLALAGAAALAPGFAPLQAWVGICWTGQVSPTAVDRHCFSAILDGRHVRDEHQVSVGGRVVYAGETLYSLEGEELLFTYYTSLGGIGRGVVRKGSAGLTFTGTMRANPSASPKPFRSDWRMTSPAGYEVTTDGKTVIFRSGPEPAR
ncbi:hypothetical protein [Sphingomonas arenae]|uniref:hypothetical protein n=1 Tax=Sphingomonas arenae TaxID=2812555 RepID=UPI001967677B|nr:hypothetical protein [Sphingomonas arenae]